MTEKPEQDPKAQARYDAELFPQSYESWRYCIEQKCGLRLTPDYIRERISILTDARQEETQALRADLRECLSCAGCRLV